MVIPMATIKNVVIAILLRWSVDLVRCEAVGRILPLSTEHAIANVFEKTQKTAWATN